MAWVRVATSSGSMAGNIAMRSWLRPSLRYGSVSTMPLARSACGDGGGVDVVGEVDGADDVAALRRAWPRTAARTCSPRPSRRAARRSGRSARRTTRARPARASTRTLSSSRKSDGERGGVVGLVEAGVLERDREAERRRHPAIGGTETLDALDRGGGAQREPEPAVAGEALLGREVVDVEALGLDREAAGAGGGVDEHEAVVAGTAHLGHHAGRRLVVRVRVGVDGGVGDELGMGARLGAEHHGLVEERRGAR